jgi:cytochrome c peroxidase
MTRSIVAASLVSLLLLSCDDDKKKMPDPRAAPDQPAAPSTATAGVTGAGTTQDVHIDESLLPAFGALPAAMESKDNPLTEDKILLGRALFYETRLSASNEISCNTCHVLTIDGADQRKTSIGHKKQAGKRNAPTVYNAAGHFVQFWDGRAKTIEDQAKGPITNPVEMAMQDEKSVLAEIRKVKWYAEQFKKAFPETKGDAVTMDNLAKAIGAFERKLVTPSRWDKFLGGDKNALTAAEKAGFKKFTETGCNTCHAGPYVGGAMFQKLGLVKPWPKQDDQGRFEVTKQDVDKMMFKVPSLRNVEKTGPYFHDGSTASLDEAVKLMANHQLGKTLSDADAASIVAFLKSLTGEIPKDYIAEYKVPSEIPPAPKPGPTTAPGTPGTPPAK